MTVNLGVWDTSGHCMGQTACLHFAPLCLTLPSSSSSLTIARICVLPIYRGEIPAFTEDLELLSCWPVIAGMGCIEILLYQPGQIPASLQDFCSSFPVLPPWKGEHSQGCGGALNHVDCCENQTQGRARH